MLALSAAAVVAQAAAILPGAATGASVVARPSCSAVVGAVSSATVAASMEAGDLRGRYCIRAIRGQHMFARNRAEGLKRLQQHLILTQRR